MLRDIRSPFLKPRIIPFSYTTASSAVTINEGVGEFTGTSSGTGIAALTWTRAFARAPIVVANTSSVDVAAGGFVCLTAAPSASGVTLTSKNPSNAADDGKVHGVALGFDSSQTGRFSRRANVLTCRDAGTRIEAFQINTATAGTIVINNYGATLTRSGTGAVTLTFRKAFRDTPVVIATPNQATCAVCNIGAVTASSVAIACTNSGGTAADAIFNLIVIGDDSGAAGASTPTPVRSSQRKPIIFGYTIAYNASGVPDYGINSGDATITDTGTGRATFTFTEPFKREAIICCIPTQAGSAMKRAQIDTSSATGFEVKYFSSAPALEDPADTYGAHIIGVGFDDASEY